MARQVKKTDRTVAEAHMGKGAAPISTGDWYVTSTGQFDVLAERLEIARNIIEAHRAYIKQLQFEKAVLLEKSRKVDTLLTEYQQAVVKG